MQKWKLGIRTNERFSSNYITQKWKHGIRTTKRVSCNSNT